MFLSCRPFVAITTLSTGYVTSTPTRPVDNVVIATKGLQDRNINILAGTTVENKGKLILTDHEVAGSIPSISTNFKCGLGLERSPPSLVRTIG